MIKKKNHLLIFHILLEYAFIKKTKRIIFGLLQKIQKGKSW